MHIKGTSTFSVLTAEQLVREQTEAQHLNHAWAQEVAAQRKAHQQNIAFGSIVMGVVLLAIGLAVMAAALGAF